MGRIKKNVQSWVALTTGNLLVLRVCIHTCTHIDTCIYIYTQRLLPLRAPYLFKRLDTFLDMLEVVGLGSLMRGLPQIGDASGFRV